ncbi:uncharacterized protein K02A2.6-like [Portunus trituberculatus]|uniref:uncharacterized protein K02A2.6-like n=1 Tax=Portunus trituberculatus TaxID=210409 RepID=UPI001E1D0F8E|nr:uncharacterized protein K02A2.6-like [Portunus trituberculatus]
MREKLTAYTFTTSWQKGKEHNIPDALSRFPVQAPNEEDKAASDDEDLLHALVIASVNAVTQEGTSLMPLRDKTLEKVRASAVRDPEYSALRTAILTGFPEHKQELVDDLRPYWKIRDQLAVDDDLVVYGPRLIIPKGLRRETLQRLHDSHQGIARTKRRARQTVYWPGIERDIAQVVSSCRECRALLPRQANEPLWQHDDPPTRVFESVSADYFHLAGRTFLVYIDRKSGWPCVSSCPRSANGHHLTCELRNFFAATGVPRVLSDGGPQFASSTHRRFLARWGVEHRITSPYNARANGHAEAAVKVIKKLIRTTSSHASLDDDAFARGLLELRNTPREDGRSPAQVLFGHPMKSALPVHHRSFAPEWQQAALKCDIKADHLRSYSKIYHDKTSKPLSQLQIGALVDVWDHATNRWGLLGIITGVGSRRDYLVKMGSGRTLWRNRRFLRSHQNEGVFTYASPSQSPPNVVGENIPSVDQPEPRKLLADQHLSASPPLRRSTRHRREPDRLAVRWGTPTYADEEEDDRDVPDNPVISGEVYDSSMKEKSE